MVGERRGLHRIPVCSLTFVAMRAARLGRNRRSRRSATSGSASSRSRWIRAALPQPAIPIRSTELPIIRPAPKPLHAVSSADAARIRRSPIALRKTPLNPSNIDRPASRAYIHGPSRLYFHFRARNSGLPRSLPPGPRIAASGVPRLDPPTPLAILLLSAPCVRLDANPEPGLSCLLDVMMVAVA